MGVRGRFALVTGAASGMGRATAMMLAAEGANVALCDLNSSEDVVTEVKAAISSKSSAIVASFEFDARDAHSITVLAERVLAWSGGRLDILVNNAGVACFAALESDSEYDKAWELCMAVNVTAQQRLSRALLPALLRSGRTMANGSGGGRIINISSMEGTGATLFNSPYVASKHASIGLTKAMALELGPRGVTVNALCPGPVRTGMTAGIPEGAKTRWAKRKVPARRYGEATEVAFLSLSLADERASFVNGAVLHVDGGTTANNSMLPMRLPWEDREVEAPTAGSTSTSKL